MAQNGRFALSLRVLTVLAEDQSGSMTSAAIAEALGESAVMVRRTFRALAGAGFISLRKGPNGGARLSLTARDIRLGDLYAATTPGFLELDDKRLASLMKRIREDAVAAINEHSLGAVIKRSRKG